MSRNPSRPRPSGELQHQAEHTQPARRGSSVLIYLMVMFVAAFLLLCLAYFQQQRSSADATDDAMKQSASALQSIENLLTESKRLQQEVSELESQVNSLTQEKTALEQSAQTWADQADAAERQLAAMDYFWRIQRLYSRGSRRDALELVKEFESSGLSQELPRANPSDLEGTSPADQYQSLLDALNYRPEP